MQTLQSGWWRLVKFGFRLLYNEMAFTYDAVSWAVSLGEWKAWGRVALNYLEASAGTPILELAHGPGHLQIALHNAGYLPYGIDLSRNMGHMAAQRLRRAGFPTRLARANAGRLPFPPEAFGGMVCTFPTAFIVAPNTLGEAYRVLRPGGRLVIVPNAGLTRGGIAKQGIDLAYRITGQGNSPTANGGTPTRIWEQLSAPFHAAGFSLRADMAVLKRSVAQVLIAHKPT